MARHKRSAAQSWIKLMAITTSALTGVISDQINAKHNKLINNESGMENDFSLMGAKELVNHLNSNAKIISDIANEHTSVVAGSKNCYPLDNSPPRRL
ncbi:MAG: hypothetical protein Q8R83_08230 [Legionellaceae bacterium]|nr:hypothetical protein [Legionellaceae bacterium]